MRGACSALLAVLAATALARPDSHVLEQVKARILDGLGMAGPPDLSNVTTSAAHLGRISRRYWRRQQRTDAETRFYTPTGYETDNGHLLFQIEDWRSLRWARLQLANDTSIDVTNTLRQWKSNTSSEALKVPCQECKDSTLKISAHGLRTKRAACSKECCRRPLKISFKEIGWDWIVQPAEFEAFYCKGRCRNLADDFASTHALMQSILNYKGRKVARPCCAPRKLRALDLLHYNDKNPPELVVTRHKGMIVKECACA